MIRVLEGTLTRKATPRGCEIAFLTKDLSETDKLFNRDIKRSLIADFKPERKKRSLNANSYMWILCDKIADAINTTKEQVYQDAVKQVGVWADIAVERAALARFMLHWESKGIGYFTEFYDTELKDWSKVRCYYGSSMYDPKEMSRLVDYIVEQAKDLDIETETPEEIARMKQMWGTE